MGILIQHQSVKKTESASAALTVQKGVWTTAPSNGRWADAGEREPEGVWCEGGAPRGDSSSTEEGDPHTSAGYGSSVQPLQRDYLLLYPPTVSVT